MMTSNVKIAFCYELVFDNEEVFRVQEWSRVGLYEAKLDCMAHGIQISTTTLSKAYAERTHEIKYGHAKLNRETVAMIAKKGAVNTIHLVIERVS